MLARIIITGGLAFAIMLTTLAVVYAQHVQGVEGEHHFTMLTSGGGVRWIMEYETLVECERERYHMVIESYRGVGIVPGSVTACELSTPAGP
jgi:hypothetical protein